MNNKRKMKKKKKKCCYGVVKIIIRDLAKLKKRKLNE
jgi:hypothetical protein